MLIVCKPDLPEADFQRIARKIEGLSLPLRWGRRAGRLVLLLERARSDQEEVKGLAADPAVDYVLADPSEREIARTFARRDVLDLALASTGALVAAALLGPLALYLGAPAAGRTTRGDVALGKVDVIPVNGARTKLVHGEEYLIVHPDAERFVALSATCPHSNVCLVEWDEKRRQIVCPCHRGVFDLQGNVISGPPPAPLRRREVVVREGQIYVRGT
ncbi:MAG TPA: Rieske (2Fe-2S) protein [Planctomycetota bacterium]|nr:Rieske (2Fe-2S) protein [Planctomycetota bacterium]